MTLTDENGVGVSDFSVPEKTAKVLPRKGGGLSNSGLIQEFVSRIENLHGDIEKEKSEFMLRVKALRGDIKEVLEEAQEKGLPKKPLRALIKQRGLERKAQAARDDLEDMADQSAFDSMKEALGELADLPLGQAAMGSA